MQHDPAPTAAASRHSDHRVELYDSDEALAASVADFLRPGVLGGTAVAVLTPAHRLALDAAFADRGIDALVAISDGDLVVLDAAETLEGILVGGMPDRASFTAGVGDLLARASQRGGRVRVFGEMVALLWEVGRIDAAMALESEWNALAETHDFGLLCAYPSALFARADTARDLAAMCDLHTVADLPSELQWWPAAHRSGGADDRVVRFELAADRRSGARARAHLREVLSAWDMAHRTDEAELLLSEVINNAVLHARSPVTVAIGRRGRTVRAEVSDLGGGVPVRVDTHLRATHGRGLMLVEAFSSAWGVAADGHRKTVWFELDEAS